MSLTLETTRLEIRPWLAKDVDHYLTLANDVGYTAFSLAGQFALTSTEAAERIKDRTDLLNQKKLASFYYFLKRRMN
ncbi:MAG: hypothetical protein IPK04_16765 [Bdellovibrionales bacterium]|nr:hypothetical protein [Bdellovibrionales bacterium]